MRRKSHVSFIMVKPLQLSTFKMNLFFEWSIQNKWMKNWEEIYCFTRCFCEMNLNIVDYKVNKQYRWK